MQNMEPIAMGYLSDADWTCVDSQVTWFWRWSWLSACAGGRGGGLGAVAMPINANLYETTKQNKDSVLSKL